MLDDTLVEFDTNNFRLSIKNKRNVHKMLRTVFEEYRAIFVQKLGDYNVYTVVGCSPIKTWSGLNELLTPTEALHSGVEVYLYKGLFPIKEKTNRAARSDLYRLFSQSSDYQMAIIDKGCDNKGCGNKGCGPMVLWSRKDDFV